LQICRENNMVYSQQNSYLMPETIKTHSLPGLAL
jgi:hypothetical protein